MKQHRWSGYPGCYCQDCGMEDGMEIAIGCGDYDPYTDKWVNPLTRLKYETAFPKECVKR
jgi:hypothetical protein